MRFLQAVGNLRIDFSRLISQVYYHLTNNFNFWWPVDKKWRLISYIYSI